MERKTQQRAAIRHAFEATDRPLSPLEVLRAARPGARGLGIATVYRTVKGLLAEGWLVPVHLPGEPPRYEASGKVHHHHFRCRACAKVFEIQGCPGNLKRFVPRGFRVDGHEFVLYGRCAECVEG